METWLISDTHFGHKNFLSFKDDSGEFIRPFALVEEMDSFMIERWNKVVKPTDKVYHLGDVAFTNVTGFRDVMSKLNGTKVVIKGNHDDWFKPSVYLDYFKDIRAYHVLDKILLSHIPIHPDSLARWKGQVHGHVHNNSLSDKRYLNVSVEVIDYTPINFETVRKHFKELHNG